MKISVGVILYWFAGMLLDMLYGLKVTDFYLPSDYIQQIEIQIISHVIIFLTWTLGLAGWVWALKKINEKKAK